MDGKLCPEIFQPPPPPFFGILPNFWLATINQNLCGRTNLMDYQDLFYMIGYISNYFVCHHLNEPI